MMVMMIAMVIMVSILIVMIIVTILVMEVVMMVVRTPYAYSCGGGIYVRIYVSLCMTCIQHTYVQLYAYKLYSPVMMGRRLANGCTAAVMSAFHV